MNEAEISKALNEARYYYYLTDSPIMTDSEFDDLEEKLRQLNPNHEYFTTVGSDVDLSNKIYHREPLLSMGKAKTSEEANKWFQKINLPGIDYCIQPKIDGLAATCRYVNGKLLYVATRGDGVVGQDISHVSKYIDDIKSSINFSNDDIEIRGELYLPKNTIYDTKGKSLRNNCVGLINRKENRDDLKYVRFVCYQISGNHNIKFESDKIKTLQNNGFHTVDYEVLNTGSEISTYYMNYLKHKRVEWNYETDGIILTINDNSLHDEVDSRWIVDHHHHYNLAIKPPSEGKETRLLSIDWQVSRQGSLIPVAIFEPINIGGARLERATLHNYDNVKKLNLAVGDILYVERANDVIPYVKENRSQTTKDGNFVTNLIPTSCPSCSSKLTASGVHLKCSNSNCNEILLQQIIYWVKEAGIDGVAEGTLKSLFNEKKIRHVKDLYLLKYEDLVGIEGFGDKKISGFIDGIKKSSSMSAVSLLSRLGIPLVQEKSLKKLGINTIDDFNNFNNIDYVIGQNIISWRDDPLNIEFLKELLEVINIEDVIESDIKGYIAMTGKGPLPRKDIIEKINSMGWAFSSTITKDVSILLCEDIEGQSSKLLKARKLGIILKTYDEFMKS
ncbi:MAG: hypothetical protein JXR64_12875 [Spirochaetales bacterium]|nr:hypothetical protein [Spirochaetales bacterium]